ncbi:cadmium-translocating P-type ATPase [Marinomonas agarivorans]|nr:cadmium-translocating P-type ATPase [Marinomonas agarivorans]
MSKTPCFHCGDPIPKNLNITSQVEGETAFFCCYGCHAIAEFIRGADLTSYYNHRTKLAENPSNRNTSRTNFELIQDEEIYPLYVFIDDDKNHQIQLSIRGMTCAACAWLIEKKLEQIKGVKSIHINLSSSIATLLWQPEEVTLTQIGQEIEMLGYEAAPYRADELDINQQQARKTSIVRLGIAGVGMMQVMMSAIAIYAGEIQGIDEGLKALLRWSSFIFATPVVFYSAAPFFKSAIRDIKTQYFTMDLPVSLGIGLAYISSVYALFTHSGHVYFDSVTMFAFFLLLGRFLEETARHKSTLDNKHRQELTSVTRINPDGTAQLMPIGKIKVGDLIRVLPGETIPTDGIIIKGESSVDESTLTGEYAPIHKTVGSQLIAFTTNIEQMLDIKVTAIGKQTRAAAIERLTERALSEKPKIALIANKIAHYFVICVLFAASFTYLGWSLTGSNEAYWIMVSVLVVTCPCALSLATPVALTTATNKLKKVGLLVTRGHVIESLAKSKHLVFDKTGTLTYGQFDIVSIDSNEKEKSLAICAALEAESIHPIAQTFHPFISDLKAHDIKNQVGSGVEGCINGSIYKLGNLNFVTDVSTNLFNKKQLIEANESSNGLTLYLASAKEGIIATIQLQDRLRDKVQETIQTLRQHKFTVSLLSGDTETSAKSILQPNDFDHFLTEMTPEEKWSWINTQQDKKHTVMIGDGLNDVPTLAGANTSIAMAASSDLAKTHADAILLNNNINSINDAIKIAIKCKKIIKQNLFWAATYNLIMLPAAVFGFVPPWAAAIGMALSSLMVVLNANRLSY